jgi:hypothetical protein
VTGGTLGIWGATICPRLVAPVSAGFWGLTVPAGAALGPAAGAGKVLVAAGGGVSIFGATGATLLFGTEGS